MNLSLMLLRVDGMRFTVKIMKTNPPEISASTRPRYVLGGAVMEQHLAGVNTTALFSLFENRSAASSRTPIHVHADDDETLYMLAGEMTAIVEGKRHPLRVGESIFLPRRIAHQLVNESGAPAHYLLLCTPSGFEGFLEEGGHLLSEGEEPTPPSQEDIARMKRAAPKFGITLLQDWETNP